MEKIEKMFNFLKEHKWQFAIILLFIAGSYFIIGSDYKFVHGDAGAFARYAKVFYETNRIDTTGAATALIGQLLFSKVFCHLFGFSLKNLHICVYIANFLFLIGMYLLLYEFGLNKSLALIGSLSIIISPITIKMIDWYMTEPFFMFYLVFSLLFFIKGLKSESPIQLYVGGIFGVLAILTRQHAVSLPIALIVLCIVYRRQLKKRTFYHCIISSIMPIIAIALYYAILFFWKRLQGSVPYGYAPENIAILKSFINPINLITRLYYDSLFFLHYGVLYLAAPFVILFISLLLDPKKFKDLSSNLTLAVISILYISIGTIYLDIKYNSLMPYKHSIFNIGALTKIFKFTLLSKNTASYLLTLFTWIGAVIILIKILEHFLGKFFLKAHPVKGKRKNSGKQDTRVPQINLGERLIFLWGIIYMLVAILIGLRYERYILPFSIVIIFILLMNFLWIEKQKLTTIVVFILIYSVFIYGVANHRFLLDLKWEAGEYCLKKGIPTYELNIDLGFNNFYSFEDINNLYKNVNTKRPINWQLFHPMANYFIQSKAGLDAKMPGIELYKSFHKTRWFGLLKHTYYVYKRRKGYKKPIWF